MSERSREAKQHNLSLEMAYLLAKALNVPMEDLVKVDEIQ